MSGGIKYTTVRWVASVIALFGSLSFALLAATGLAQSSSPESVTAIDRDIRVQSVMGRQAQPNSRLTSVGADLDNDGDVDLFDWAVFLPCLEDGGPNKEVPPGSSTSNLFADEGIQHVDLRDWRAFQTRFGNGQSPRIDRFAPTPRRSA